MPMDIAQAFEAAKARWPERVVWVEQTLSTIYDDDAPRCQICMFQDNTIEVSERGATFEECFEKAGIREENRG